MGSFDYALAPKRHLINTRPMLRIAVIGLGRWGVNLERTLNEIGGVDVVTANTPKQTEKLLKDDELSGVVIATPGATHAKVALPFIERGLPTFIEKPFTTSLVDAQKLEKAARHSGAQVMVGHIHLYNPAYHKTKELAAHAGNIRLLHFEGMNNGPYRDDMSAFWDWAPHDVAMAIDLTQSLPKTVQAWGVKTLRPRTNLYDFAQIKLDFPKKVTAFLTTTWLSPRKAKQLTVIGTRDTIVFDDTAEKKVTLHKGLGPQPIVISRGNQHATRILKKDPTISHPRYSSKSPLEIELRAFLKTVKAGTNPAKRKAAQPPTGLENAMDVTRILAAAEKSLQNNAKLIRL